jgi:hypothetical protein
MGAARSVLLIPGFFGFGAFGPARGPRIEYFARVRAELAKHLPPSVSFDHHEPPPTGSLAARVASLWEKVRASTARLDLVGHSAGGLDARLLANPAFTWPGAPSDAERQRTIDRIGTIVTVAAPFHGTPSARRLGPFADRVLLGLYLLSILTSGADLRFGGSLLLVYMMGLRRIGLRGSWNDRVIQRFLSAADEETASQIRRFLKRVVDDHRIIDDLRPDNMATLNTKLGVSEFPRIRSFATVSPRPFTGLRVSGDPLDALIRRGIYAVAYEATEPSPEEQRPFPKGPWIGAHEPSLHLETPEANDGVVPTGCQTLNGQAAGIVAGDHLDVIGHFESKGGGGTFFKSGAHFDDARFAAFWAAVANEINMGPNDAA